jgi:catechol 2,3-dioxygenase-like lactoylglutathione lyase family enzyme
MQTAGSLKSSEKNERRLEMLGDNEATATIPVKNLGAARKFYEDTLGLKLVHTEGEEAVSYQSGNTHVLVYHSQYAGTNKATAATWMVSDIESLVKDLKARGVSFEHYDMPGVTRTGDIHLAGPLKNAWFKDPDGNIIALVSEQ